MNLLWARDPGTGYIATVGQGGGWDGQYYIVPGIMNNPARVYTYHSGPIGHGTIEECKRIAGEHAGKVLAASRFPE